MADSRRPNARYNSGHRSNQFSTNMNTNVREFTLEQHCNCNNRNLDTMSTQWMASFPLGMAYVPMQQFTNLYDMEVGLQRGTIFAQIDFPFEIGFCARGCNCQ